MTKNNIGESYANVMPARHLIRMALPICCPVLIRQSRLKKQSYAGTLTFTLFFIVSCELLQLNCISHLASLKLLGRRPPLPLALRMPPLLMIIKSHDCDLVVVTTSEKMMDE